MSDISSLKDITEIYDPIVRKGVGITIAYLKLLYKFDITDNTLRFGDIRWYYHRVMLGGRSE